MYQFFFIVHIFSFVSWMIGMLYLPRLFVYHTKAKTGGEADLMLQQMEGRLLKIIMNPAMVSTIIFGVLMIFSNSDYFLRAGWLHLKIFLVIILLILHIMMIKFTHNFKFKTNSRSQIFFRIFNEVPAIIMLLIIILVVTKPF